MTTSSVLSAGSLDLSGLSSREVRSAQQKFAEHIRSPEFLDAEVRPHLAASSGDWNTTIVQLDGTGAFNVRAALGDGSGVFVKAFLDDSGGAVYEKLRALRAAGLGEGSRYQALEPLAWLPDYRVLLTREAPGSAVSDLAGDQETYVAAVGAAGAWLGRLHTVDVRIGQPRSLLVTGELVSLAKRLSKVTAASPGYLPRAQEMIDVLDRLTGDTVDGVLAQSHGQYRPIHVFVSDPLDGSSGAGTVTGIDLDRSAPADPARDVAEFLHRLRVTVWKATGSVEGAEAPSRAFLRAYRESSGRPEHLANLRFHLARYAFHSLNRKIKEGDATLDENPTYLYYRSEFDRAADGDLG